MPAAGDEGAVHTRPPAPRFSNHAAMQCLNRERHLGRCSLRAGAVMIVWVNGAVISALDAGSNSAGTRAVRQISSCQADPDRLCTG
jgi:hypothetical protein